MVVPTEPLGGDLAVHRPRLRKLVACLSTAATSWCRRVQGFCLEWPATSWRPSVTCVYLSATYL